MEKAPYDSLKEPKAPEVKDFQRDGRLKLIHVDNMKDNSKPVDLRPGQRKKWLIINAWGYHDDASARNSNWQYSDGIKTIAPTAVVSEAANQKQSIFLAEWKGGSTTIIAQNIILTRDVFAQFKVASLASGKYAYADALVLELDK